MSVNEQQKSVLVVDDEIGIRLALQANFRRDGWRVDTAANGADAIQKLRLTQYPLVVTDVRMPEGDGLSVMRCARESNRSTAVVLLTAFGSVPEAVEAMRDGACDYLMKPVSFEQLQAVIDRVMVKAGTAPVAVTGQRGIIGNSPALARTLARALHVAATEADILIEAESGTGKELLAHYIHEMSNRKSGNFVAVNCAAVPEHLLESELFGHVRGAFTGATNAKPGKFEIASNGTILLDEIGEMPLDLQPKLLRVLQEREIERIGDHKTIRANVRVIATTNRSLQTMVGEGRFRADLYYRLNVIPLTIPPLRERREDIPVLASFFAERFAAECGRPDPKLQPEFLAGLEVHSWPGNIRELSNYIRRVVALNSDGQIGPEYLSREYLHIAPRTNVASSVLKDDLPMEAGVSMRDAERRLLEKTLEATNGNRTHAAEILGVSLRTIRNKIREFGLPPRRYA